MIRIAILIGALFLTAPSVVKAEVVIIGNTTTAPKDMSLKDVRDVFWGKKRKWDNGVPIRVFLLSSANPSTLEFYSEYMGVLPSTYWATILKQDSNETDFFLPTILPTDAAVYHAIDCTPGGIGYISNAEFNYHDTDHDMIKGVDVNH
jgi:hypothetical protein